MALILKVSLLVPTTPLTVIAPPFVVTLKFAPFNNSILPPLNDRLLAVFSIVVATLISTLSAPLDSKVVVPSKL